MLAKRWLLPLALLTFAPGLCATPPAPTPPVEPDIILPGLDPVPPAPTPQPTPAITKLTSAELYVIEGKVPLLVLASPEGIVSVTEETGPVKVRAIFAGNQKYSTRSIKGPSVYFVEAVGTGRVELLITRTDGKGKLIRRTLDVNGPGPAPTPDPVDPVIPPTPAPVGFRVIFVYETADALTPAMQRVMFGEKVRTYLDTRSKGYRRWDKDVDATNEKDADIKALWQAARPKVTTVPCIIVAVGGKADIIPFPADEDAALAILQKYAEGK